MSTEKYCILKVTQHTFNKKCDVEIDFGSQDAPAEYIEFLDGCAFEVDALNFMTSKGWEFVNSNSNQTLYVTRHLMVKRA